MKRRVADNARRILASDPQGFVDAYRSRFGSLLGADNAAELFQDYALSPQSRARFHTAVHAAARWVRDAIYSQALASPNGANRVIFTSGGSASGKTTLAPALMRGGDALLYDSTLSVMSGAQAVIEAALAAGKSVSIVHIRRPLDDAFRANLCRATQPPGNGRVTTVKSMMSTHRGADEVLTVLAAEYRNDARIEFLAFENSGGPLVSVPVDSLKPRDYAGADEWLRRVLESQRENLPRYVYEAARGRSAR